METHKKDKRIIYINDLDCNLIPVNWSDEQTDADVYWLLVKSMFKFTNNTCTTLLVQHVQMLISAFVNHRDNFFFTEVSSDGFTYYRFSNDANFSMNFIPLTEDNTFLLTFSAGIEQL